MFNLIEDFLQKHTKNTMDNDFQESLKYVIDTNIILADFLKESKLFQSVNFQNLEEMKFKKRDIIWKIYFTQMMKFLSKKINYLVMYLPFIPN